MKRTGLTTSHWLATLALASLAWAAPAGAQSQNMTPQDRDDLTRQQLAGFDQFLDNHPDLATQIRNNPSLVNSEEYVEAHPNLQQYLQQHPEVREDLSQNPNAVMHQEQRFERREEGAENRDRDHDRDRGDITQREMTTFDWFLDAHPEIAEQLKKNPGLADNKEFVESHPALKQFLAENPGVRDEIRENPNGFMSAERRNDYREEQGVLSRMDQFLDSHPEIAQQLQKDPSLINNKQFVKSHPALQQFLASHSEAQQQFEANPNAFMHREDRYDRREDARMDHRDHDVTRGELGSFHEFLGGHAGISSELSKNPSLATNEEYLENHSELKTYLKSNPQVREELKENPQSFVKSAQTFDANSNAAVKGTMKLPAEPKK